MGVQGKQLELGEIGRVTWPDPLQPFLCSSQHQRDVWAFLTPLSSPVLLTGDEVTCPESRFCARGDSAKCWASCWEVGRNFLRENQLYPD